MIKHYVFWGCFALVMIGIVATLLRDRARRLRDPAAQAKARAAQTPAGAPTPAAAEAALNPTATRIYSTPATARAPTAAKANAAMLPASASARLVPVSGTLKGRRFEVTAAGITIGRDADNDVVIADSRVSHHHAWIGIVDNQAVLRDLGSSNGTFLNAKMDSRISEVVLHPQDTILFGGHGGDQFRFLAD